MAGTQTSNSKRPASDTAVGPAARVRGGGCCPPRGGSDGRRGPRPPPSSAAPGTEVGDKGDFRVPAVIYQTLLLSAVRSRERGSEDRSGRDGAGRGGRLRRAASQGGLGARAAAFVRVGLAPASVIGVCGGSEVGLGRVRLPVSVIDVRHRCPELGPASGLGSDSLPVRGRVRCLVSVIGVRHRCLGRVRFPVWDQIHFRSRVGSSFRCLSSALVIGVWVGSSFRSGVRSTSVRGRVRCLVSVIGVRHRCLGRVQLPVRVRVHLLVRGQVRRPVRIGPAPAPGGHRGRAGLWVQDRRHRTLSASGR